MTPKYKKMTKKQLEQLEIVMTRKGFTIWANETHGKKRRHWIVDGSLCLEDGSVMLGNFLPEDKLQAVYDPKSNSIEFVTPK